VTFTLPGVHQGACNHLVLQGPGTASSGSWWATCRSLFSDYGPSPHRRAPAVASVDDHCEMSSSCSSRRARFRPA